MERGEIEFDFEAGKQSVKYNCSKVVLRDDTYDMLIVECANNPGAKYGFVELEEREIRPGTQSYIVHHPEGSRKKYSEGVYKGFSNVEETIRHPEFQGHVHYRFATNTGHITQGSSGSLTFDARTLSLIHI